MAKLYVPKNTNVIKKVFLTSILMDVVIICVNDYVVTLLSFRLSDEVGLMLTSPLILALLVKVNEVFGGVASAGLMSLCSASIAFALLFPTMITSLLLGFESTLGLSFSLAFEQGTPFPLPLSLSTTPLVVVRPLSNISMCFRRSYQ
jgi:hypothetical protein